MPLGTVMELLAQVALLMALGFFLKKRELITPLFQQGLSDFLMYAVMPFSVLASANSEFSPAMAGRLGGAGLIACGYYLAAIPLCRLLAKRLFRTQGAPGRQGIFATMAVFANTGFIGLPIVKALYGNEGFLYGIIYNMAYQVFLFTLGVMLLGGSRRFRWRALYGDPVTVLSVAALFIYLSPFRFPPLLDGVFNQIGDMCVPISMIVMGCCVADVKLGDILREKSAYLVSLLRLLVFPLALLAVLALLGVSPVLAASCVVLTALPVGSLNVIMAQRYGADTKFATTAVVQSMLLFLGGLPLVLLCLERWVL